MTDTDYAALQARHELDVYGKRGPVLVKGLGSKVWDADGREYIDAAGAYGVASLGHCHPEVVRAVEQQARRLISCPGTFYSDVRARLLEKLTGLAPGGLSRAFLCNSGTEAVEAALKIARLTTGRTGFVCAMRGFHGRTMGSLSATFNPEYRKGFEPLVPGFVHVPFDNLARLKEAMTEDVAGVVLEVVQGEGGVRLGGRDYFRAVESLCRRNGSLFVIDEVQTGFCRTGKMFASMHVELEPDILCVAKGIASGLPMGAILCKGEVELPPGKHGSTFGGNPLCCAAALATLSFMEEHRLAEQARKKGERLASRLLEADLRRAREVRHLGLMIGVELKEKVTPILKELQLRGVLALPAGATVLRLLPPLVITDEELDFVAAQLIAVLGSGANHSSPRFG